MKTQIQELKAQCLANKAATGEEYGAFMDTSGNCRVERINPTALYNYLFRTDTTAPVTPQTNVNGSYVTPDGKAQIDFGIRYANGYAEFSASGHYDGLSGQCIDEIAAAYPQDVEVKRWARIHAACHLKSVNSSVVDTVTFYASRFPARDFYAHQAETFLASNGLKLRATLSDSKPAPWAKDGESGRHYRVTISREGWKRDRRKAWEKIGEVVWPDEQPAANRLVFDFWGSIKDAECRQCNGTGKVKLSTPKPIQVPNPDYGKMVHAGWGPPVTAGGKRQELFKKSNAPSTLATWQHHEDCPRCKGSKVDPEPIHPTPYDILACISSDVYTPGTFADFCDEYGYDKDNIQALQTFRRANTFARRLRAFFTPAELDQLAEIR